MSSQLQTGPTERRAVETVRSSRVLLVVTSLSAADHELGKSLLLHTSAELFALLSTYRSRRAAPSERAISIPSLVRTPLNAPPFISTTWCGKVTLDSGVPRSLTLQQAAANSVKRDKVEIEEHTRRCRGTTPECKARATASESEVLGEASGCCIGSVVSHWERYRGVALGLAPVLFEWH